MLCVATATFLSSSKVRNTLVFHTMRNGTLKLQDETIGLLWPPRNCHYKHLHPLKNIRWWQDDACNKSEIPNSLDLGWTPLQQRLGRWIFDPQFVLEISHPRLLNCLGLKKMGHSIIALKMECWKTKCKKYQKSPSTFQIAHPSCCEWLALLDFNSIRSFIGRCIQRSLALS